MASSENIRAYVRVRPLPDGRQAEGSAWKISQDKSSIAHVDMDKDPYILDTIFDQHDDTKTVFDVTTKDMVRQVVEGFNSTVFAYGQTSSGKTYTMRGTSSEPGIIPLAVKELFDSIKSEERDFLVRVSYMEIYNEDIRDLLVSGEDNLAIKQSTDGIVVSGLKEELVTQAEDVMALVELGDTQRHVGETKMNARSSRSHAIFRMTVESKSPSSSGVRLSSLNLVDLAGSERISKTGAEGQRKKEGAAINKSLLTLGTVIRKLSEGASHVPYRDSKLTRILQSSLGGNAKTAIICAITPSSEHIDESHCSLAFACRAKTIVNNACVNEVLSDSALLRKQAKEIEALKNRLEMGRSDQVDEEAVRRKIQTITAMLLNKHMGDGGDNGSLCTKDRRKTWCPDVLTQKRLADSDVTYPLATKPKQRRVSDGHVKLQDQIARTVSMQHADVALEKASADEEGTLQKKMHSLQHANLLLQKQLDAMVEVLQKKKEQLRAAEADMKKIAQEKGSVLPALKEAEWKKRQLEKDAALHKDKLEEALETIKSKDVEYSRMVEEKDSLLREAQERAVQAISRLEALESQAEMGPESTKELIDAHVELDTLRLKYERALASNENLSDELTCKNNEVEILKAQLESNTKEEHKVQREQQLMEDEIERLKAHVADLEKRKRAPLYQKKQDAELEAANARAAEAEKKAEDVEHQANMAKSRLKEVEKEMQNLQKSYESKIADLSDQSMAMSKKLEAALEAASEHQAACVPQNEREETVKQLDELKNTVQEKDGVIRSIEHEMAEMRSKHMQMSSQLEEAQACADAASAHIRFLEDKAEQEDQEAKQCLKDLENKYEQKVCDMEKRLREQEDLCEKSKLDVNALESENALLQERVDMLEKRVQLASSTLNALDELKEIKKKHKEEIAKLNAQLRNVTVGSKGNERAAERATKDTNRLKSQIQDLEIKLKKSISEKSALQSEKAALDREYRTAKASLEKLNKNANRAAAVEERKRQPILKDLEDTKAKLSSLEEELLECRESLKHSEEKATGLEQLLEEEQGNNSDLERSLEELKQELEGLNTRYDNLDCLYREKENDLAAANIKITSTEEGLKEANKNVAKLNEQIRGLKGNLEQASRQKQDIQEHLESIQQDKKSLEDALSEAETKIEMMDALQLDLNSEKAHVMTLQQNFQIIEKGLEDHKKELEVYKEKNKDQEQELESLRKALGEKGEYVSSLENHVNDLVAKTMEMEASLDASKSEVKKTKSLLSQAENAIEDHENTITEIHGEKVAIEQALCETTERCNRLEHDLNTLTEQYETKCEAVSQFEEAMKLDKSSAEEMRRASKALQESFEEEKSNLLQQIETLKGQTQALQSSMEDLESAKSQIQSTFESERQNLISKLDNARTEHEKALQKLQEELRASKHATHGMSVQLEENQREIHRLKNAMEELEKRSEVLHKEKKSALESYDKLKSEMAQVQTEMAQVQTEMAQAASSHRVHIESLQSALAASHPEPSHNIESLRQKCENLEDALRKSKRREEKLQALQYRLQQDIKKSGGSLEAFQNLKDVRSLEYELDRTVNRAEREIQMLKAALAAQASGPTKECQPRARTPLSQHDENIQKV